MRGLKNNRWLYPRDLETPTPLGSGKPLLDGFVRDVQSAGFEGRISHGSVLNLVFLLASIGTVLFGNPVPFYGVSLFYRVVLLMALLAAVLTIGALVYTVLAWKDKYWGILGRVYYTLVTLASVAFLWFLNYWNLLGWRF